jgi:rubrerythrin
MRETQAVQFYIELASRAQDPDMRDLFYKLAEQEYRHKARLELEMLKEGIVVKKLGELMDVDTADYTAQLEPPPDAEYRDVVSLGVRKERLAFHYYARLAGAVHNDHLCEVLLELAEEEARHLVQFETVYSRLVEEDKPAESD